MRNDRQTHNEFLALNDVETMKQTLIKSGHSENSVNELERMGKLEKAFEETLRFNNAK